MVKDFLLFFQLSCFVRAHVDYDLYNNDGWIPITNIQAYDTGRFDVTPEQYTTQENPEYRNINDFIQVVTPDNRSSQEYSPLEGNPTAYKKRSKELFQDIKDATFALNDCKDSVKDHYRYYFKIANNITKPSYRYIVKLSGSTICPDIEDKKSNKLNSPTNTSRLDRSLKILKESSDLNKNRNIYGVLNIDNVEENIQINNQPNKSFQRKNYKVTEEAESTDTNHGYVYETPKSNTSAKLNLTNKLFNILAKYNIRADDESQNYVLSRRLNDQNPTAPELVRPFDVKARGYNSLNHLPVDPLLAVFLSHYGHYLPSAYGIRSNYNNAYGYLASNNIHNNKPFGMYKMFSDNDARN